MKWMGGWVGGLLVLSLRREGGVCEVAEYFGGRPWGKARNKVRGTRVSGWDGRAEFVCFFGSDRLLAEWCGDSISG